MGLTQDLWAKYADCGFRGDDDGINRGDFHKSVADVIEYCAREADHFPVLAMFQSGKLDSSMTAEQIAVKTAVAIVDHIRALKG